MSSKKPQLDPSQVDKIEKLGVQINDSSTPEFNQIVESIARELSAKEAEIAKLKEKDQEAERLKVARRAIKAVLESILSGIVQQDNKTRETFFVRVAQELGVTEYKFDNNDPLKEIAKALANRPIFIRKATASANPLLNATPPRVDFTKAPDQTPSPQPAAEPVIASAPQAVVPSQEPVIAPAPQPAPIPQSNPTTATPDHGRTGTTQPIAAVPSVISNSDNLSSVKLTEREIAELYDSLLANLKIQNTIESIGLVNKLIDQIKLTNNLQYLNIIDDPKGINLKLTLISLKYLKAILLFDLREFNESLKVFEEILQFPADSFYTPLCQVYIQDIYIRISDYPNAVTSARAVINNRTSTKENISKAKFYLFLLLTQENTGSLEEVIDIYLNSFTEEQRTKHKKALLNYIKKTNPDLSLNITNLDNYLVSLNNNFSKATKIPVTPDQELPVIQKEEAEIEAILRLINVYESNDSIDPVTTANGRTGTTQPIAAIPTQSAAAQPTVVPAPQPAVDPIANPDPSLVNPNTLFFSPNAPQQPATAPVTQPNAPIQASAPVQPVAVPAVLNQPKTFNQLTEDEKERMFSIDTTELLKNSFLLGVYENEIKAICQILEQDSIRNAYIDDSMRSQREVIFIHLQNRLQDLVFFNDARLGSFQTLLNKIDNTLTNPVLKRALIGILLGIVKKIQAENLLASPPSNPVVQNPQPAQPPVFTGRPAPAPAPINPPVVPTPINPPANSAPSNPTPAPNTSLVQTKQSRLDKVIARWNSPRETQTVLADSSELRQNLETYIQNNPVIDGARIAEIILDDLSKKNSTLDAAYARERFRFLNENPKLRKTIKYLSPVWATTAGVATTMVMPVLGPLAYAGTYAAINYAVDDTLLSKADTPISLDAACVSNELAEFMLKSGCGSTPEERFNKILEFHQGKINALANKERTLRTKDVVKKLSFAGTTLANLIPNPYTIVANLGYHLLDERSAKNRAQNALPAAVAGAPSTPSVPAVPAKKTIAQATIDYLKDKTKGFRRNNSPIDNADPNDISINTDNNS